MKVTLRAVQIYGSSSYYDRVESPSSTDSAIYLENYADDDVRCSIFLGEIPDQVHQMLRRRKALSRLLLSKVFGALSGQGADPTDSNQLFDDILEDIPQELFDPEYKWFLTFLIDRDVDIVDAYINEGAVVWVNPEGINDVAGTFRASAGKHLRSVAMHATTVIDPLFLEIPLVEGQVFLLSQNLKAVPWPLWSLQGGTATLSVGHSALNAKRLEVALHRAASLPAQQHASLETLSYWYLRAIAERDPWKQFVWSFTALEVMCNKLWKEHYDHVTEALTLEGVDS